MEKLSNYNTMSTANHYHDLHEEEHLELEKEGMSSEIELNKDQVPLFRPDQKGFVSNKEKNMDAIEIEDEKANEISLDHLLSKRLKFRRYQYVVSVMIALLLVGDGCESLVISFIIPVLESEWKLSPDQQSMIGSFIFFGFMIGSLMAGPVGDKFGRKKPLIFSMIGITITAIASAFVPNFPSLLIVRAIFGTFIGIVAPLSSTYQAEVTPPEMRGKMLTLVSVAWTFGEMITILIAYLSLTSLTSGNWRALLLWSSAPSFIAMIIAFFFLDESPRYLLLNNRFDEGLKLITKIGVRNFGESFQTLTEEERLALKAWANRVGASQSSGKGNFLELVKGDRKKISPLLWSSWFVTVCVYYGIMYILPSTLSKLNNKVEERTINNEFIDIIISVSFEIPSTILALLMIEKKGFGRKNSLIISFLLGSLSCIGAFAVSNSSFILFSTAARFFLNMAFIFIYPFTLESYHTNIRATGLGTSSAFGRIGGVLMPWFILMGQQISLTGPFLIFAILLMISTLTITLIPYDTTGCELDKDHIKSSKN